MKNLFFLLFAALLIFPACQKCVTCSYTHDGVTYTSGEQCGRRYVINELEDEWKETATFFNTTAICE